MEPLGTYLPKKESYGSYYRNPERPAFGYFGPFGALSLEPNMMHSNDGWCRVGGGGGQFVEVYDVCVAPSGLGQLLIGASYLGCFGIALFHKSVKRAQSGCGDTLSL